MTKLVAQFGQMFAAQNGMKYLAVSADTKKVWLYNEFRDLVVAALEDGKWRTTFVRNGSTQKAIYSDEHDMEENNPLPLHYQIRGIWNPSALNDLIQIRIGEVVSESGSIQRYASLGDNGGFLFLDNEKFMERMKGSKWEFISISFQPNSSMANFHVYSSFGEKEPKKTEYSEEATQAAITKIDNAFRPAPTNTVKAEETTAGTITKNQDEVLFFSNIEAEVQTEDRKEPPRMVPRDLGGEGASPQTEEDRPVTTIGNVGIRRRDL